MGGEQVPDKHYPVKSVIPAIYDIMVVVTVSSVINIVAYE